MTPAAIVSKLWNYCNVLRDDGMSYGDYVEQLTYLLFLKMADERTKPPYNQPSAVPTKYNWPTLLKKDGDDLFYHYRHMLESLGCKKTCWMHHQIQKYRTSLAVTIQKT
jgi:type I restriction enzyme M protein